MRIWKLYVDMTTICPIQLTTYVAFPITHVEFDHNWPTDIRNMQMDDNDDDNTYEKGQTITILKPPLSLRVI